MLEVVFLAIIVGFNNLFGAMALKNLSERRWPIVLVFGVFLFGVTFVGASLGEAASAGIPEFGKFLAPGILIGLGAWIVSTAFRPRRVQRGWATRLTSWPGLIFFAFAFSWDEMLVGVSLGLEGYEPLAIAVAIGFSSLLFTLLGTYLGDHLKTAWQKNSHLLAGALLLTFGLVSLMSVLRDGTRH